MKAIAAATTNLYPFIGRMSGIDLRHKMTDKIDHYTMKITQSGLDRSKHKEEIC